VPKHYLFMFVSIVEFSVLEVILTAKVLLPWKIQCHQKSSFKVVGISMIKRLLLAEIYCH